MIYLTFLLNITFILQFRFVGTNSVSIYCFMDYFICHHKTFFHIDIKTFNHWIHKEHYVCVLRMRGDKNPTSWPLSILIANICIGNLKLFLLVAQTNHITHKTEMKHNIIYRNPVYVALGASTSRLTKQVKQPIHEIVEIWPHLVGHHFCF